MANSADALSYLDTAAEGSVSVLTHVGEIYDKLVDFGSDRAIDYFEPFSYIVKEEREPEKRPLLTRREKQGPDFEAAAATKSRVQSFLFPTQRLTAEGEEEEEDKGEKAADDAADEGGGGDERHAEEESNNEGEVPKSRSFLSQSRLFLCTIRQ
jgi:hypothetical protein